MKKICLLSWLILSTMTLFLSPIASAQSEVGQNGETISISKEKTEALRVKFESFMKKKKAEGLQSQQELKDIKIAILFLAALGVALPAGFTVLVAGAPVFIPVAAIASKDACRLAFKGAVLTTGGLAIVPALLVDTVAEFGINTLVFFMMFFAPILAPASIIASLSIIGMSSFLVGLLGVKYIYGKYKKHQVEKTLKFLSNAAFKNNKDPLSVFAVKHLDKIMEKAKENPEFLEWHNFKRELKRQYSHSH